MRLTATVVFTCCDADDHEHWPEVGEDIETREGYIGSIMAIEYTPEAVDTPTPPPLGGVVIDGRAD